jgi:hypothetical protein
LRKQSTDYTHDQRRSIPVLQKWYHEGKDVFSFDLRSATDRLPLPIQGLVLALSGLSHEGVEAWYELMIGDPFVDKFHNKHYYATGQGIGSYSSWSSLAVTHHVLVRLAAVRCGHSHFHDYIILGDDIALVGADVAKEYTLIIEQLGISISLPKTILPKEGFKSAEFASKLVVNGLNISPLPLGLLLIGDTNRFLRLLISTIERATALSVPSPFQRVLEAMAPQRLTSVSRPFIVGSLDSPLKFYLKGRDRTVDLDTL